MNDETTYLCDTAIYFFFGYFMSSEKNNYVFRKNYMNYMLKQDTIIRIKNRLLLRAKVKI